MEDLKTMASLRLSPWFASPMEAQVVAKLLADIIRPTGLLDQQLSTPYDTPYLYIAVQSFRLVGLTFFYL